MITNSEKKQAYTMAIKNRLSGEYSKFQKQGGTVRGLCKTLNDTYGFSLNIDTLRNTLSSANHSTLDLFCVLAVCRYWKLDVSYILSPPENQEKPMPAAEKVADSIQYKVLDDPDYLGTYYGFLFSNKEDDATLHRMTLGISRAKDGGFTADLTVESVVSGKTGAMPLKKELRGVPILSNFNRNIAITFTDTLGNFFFLYTNYEKYLASRVYYRKGIAVTSASTAEREPVMQTFVLFDRPISEEKLCYIPGLLQPPQKTFPISEKDLQALSEESPLVAQLVEDFQYLLEHHREVFYHINEVSILAEQSLMSKPDRLRALTLLKEYAATPSKFFFSTNLAENTQFVRDFLLNESANSEGGGEERDQQ